MDKKVLEERKRKILMKLIERQKISCSKSCVAKYGIECVSVENALTRLNALYKPNIDERKLKTVIDEYLGDSYQAGYLAHAIIKKAEDWIR